jgi:hypothetical protein
MALQIVEFFGYAPTDKSTAAAAARRNLTCPFVSGPCTKTLRGDGGAKLVGGACTVRQATPNPIICCPKRLYAEEYRILQDIADTVFGPGMPIIPGNQIGADKKAKNRVFAFGSALGGEVRLPPIGGRGGFFVDWILALVDGNGELKEFVAVEVQSIDSTGNYRQERDVYLADKEFTGYSNAGINWENVNKRILPQLIYKGHVLRRETLCRAGLFFVCPTPVYDKISVRVGGKLMKYPAPAPGTLTFRWYDIGPEVRSGQKRKLAAGGQLTTTVEQLAYAFLSPGNLPPEDSYAKAIRAKIKVLGI